MRAPPKREIPEGLFGCVVAEAEAEVARTLEAESFLLIEEVSLASGMVEEFPLGLGLEEKIPVPFAFIGPPPAVLVRVVLLRALLPWLSFSGKMIVSLLVVAADPIMSSKLNPPSL